MKLSLGDLKKLQASEPAPAGTKRALSSARRAVQAIFKVRGQGYVPPGVTLRARVSKEIFTGTCDAHQLEAIRQDPQVISVEESETLRQIR